MRGFLLRLACVVAMTAVMAPAHAATDPFWSRTVPLDTGGWGTAGVLSPDGGTVFTGGATAAAPNTFVVAAYAAATGVRQWLAELPCGVSGDTCFLDDLAVAADGDTLFLAGRETASGDAYTWVTMSIDAATGADGWTSRLAHGFGCCNQVVADASRVVVAGWRAVDGRRLATTIAYDPATGVVAWRSHRSGTGYYDADLASSPDGTRLFRAVYRQGTAELETYALDAATGDVVWSRRYGQPRLHTLPGGLAVSPNGGFVVVTAWREAVADPIYRPPATLVYGAGAGHRRWAVIETGLTPLSQRVAVAVGDGRIVVAAADTTRGRALRDGDVLWTRTTAPGSPLWPYDAVVTLSPDGRRVLTATSLCDERTLRGCRVWTESRSAVGGALRWQAERDRAAADTLLVGPSGRSFVVGSMTRTWSQGEGLLTVAYPRSS